ncbi:Bug family tripartite tricarboxylate transporter substrate binding protein [Ramlibacter sp.]|uniref:Bug family tripartite tricarboxylate transporter substrate binding protein n=1 Tax=Ramlibacter sp. TaxID=1917967 RepID=UPI003D10820D
MIQRRQFAAAASLAALPGWAFAQSLTDKTVRAVVMNAPGTATDSIARFLAPHVGKATGATVVVENKVGAGGTLGTDYVAKQPADGTTLLVTNGAHYTFPWLFDKLPYDAAADFMPVANVALSTLSMFVPADSPLRTVQDVIAEAKKNPRKLSFSSAGQGTASHIAGALFNSRAGVEVAHVPYKVASQGLLDTASGQVQLGYGGMAGSLPLIKSGKLRALAVTSLKRSALLPNVPTLDESGLKGYEVVSPVFALVRAGTPAPIVAALANGVIAAAQTAEFKELCNTQGLDVEVVNTAGMREAMPREFAKWKNLVALAGAK